MRDEYSLKATEEALMGFLTPLLRLSEEEADKLAELLHDYVKARAEERAADALDRNYNRGAYRD